MAKILIIEDDPDLVHLLSLSLYKAGYDVHYAFNGQEGYDKILSLRPDLVVLDLKLPVLSGAEVLRRIGENALLRGIPVVVMSGYGDKAGPLESSVKVQGAREYLSKPFAPKDMLGLVRRVLKSGAPEAEGAGQVVKGVVRLDPRLRTVWVDDRRIATLPPRRAQLLRLLLESRGPVRRAQLVAAVWGGRAVKANTLEKTIQRLRRDLGPEGGRLQTCSDGYELVGS